MPLVVGKEYTRVEVQEAIGVPNPTHKGKWGTGYTLHEGAFYIFVNVGGAGRTGHDYPNEWDGEVLHWCGKPNTTATQPQMERMLDPATQSHIFTRHGDRDRFVYHGLGAPTEPRNSKPLMLTWQFGDTVVNAAGQVGKDREKQHTKRKFIGPLHAAYRKAKSTEALDQQSREEGLMNRNPALMERALRSHATTQNALAERLTARGIKVMSPKGAVDYDIAWMEDSGLSVAEVKSITQTNQVAQLRTGVGQLLDYVAELEHHGETISRAILVLEKEPRSVEHWQRVCDRAGILLTWAPLFPGV